MSIINEKSKKFAIRIVRLYQFLRKEKREYVISKQLLRSGTSIGANLAEAVYAISRADFLAKITIALKEASETLYWLDLLHETGYLNENQFTSLKKDADELRKLLASSAKTIKEDNSQLITHNS
jgi:four helix bundle protein